MTIETMRALVLEEFGGNLVTTVVPRPTPGPGEVLVRILASGVNPLDAKIRAGAAAHAQVTTPAILGVDMAGVVVEVGPGVDQFEPGTEVYGMTGGVGGHQGSLAEYAAVDARLLARKPVGLTLLAAAALPLAVITAWEGLVDRAQVGAHDVVLVHGGAGGVGHVAIQIARAFGATVYATGSPGNLDVIAEAGGIPIDRTVVAPPDYLDRSTASEGFDIVFDTVGGATLDASFSLVKPYTGRVVSVLGWGKHSLAPLSFRGASYSGVFTLLPLLTGLGREHHGEILAKVAQLVEIGRLTPRLAAHYGWESATLAHELVAAAGASGKVVIDLT